MTSTTTTHRLREVAAVRAPAVPWRRTMIAVESVLCLAAIAGAVQLFVGVATPPDNRLPLGLSSWVLPGFGLLASVAVPSAVAAVLAVRRHPATPAAVLAASALLGIELLVQIPFLGVAWLQAILGFIALGMAVVARAARHGGWSEPSPLPNADRRRLVSSWVAAAVAAVAGTLAAGVGAGLGIRYLLKVGVSTGTVAGLVTLGVGLALLGFAWAVGWRRLRGWRRLALVPAVLLVLVMGLPLAEATAFSVVPPTSLGHETPSSYGLSFSNVFFRTSDGALLSAWYVPTHNGAAVVVRHGAGGTRTAALPQAAVLAQAGYGLVLVDARGHGRSGGRGNDRGWYGERDTAAAVSFLTKQSGVDPTRIGVLGLSMGGEEAVGAAGTDRRVRAVVAEGVTSRTAQDKSQWLPDGVAGFVQRGMDRVTDLTIVTLSPAPKPQSLHSAIHAAGASFLLITAGKEPDEARAAASLRSAAPQRVSVWNVTDAAHTQGLAKEPAGWRTRIVAFLDTHLAAAER